MKKIFTTFTFATLLFALTALTAFAQDEPETIVVTAGSTKGWFAADQRPGGNFSYILDPTAPLGSGALQLTTDNTDIAKIQYMHAANTPLSQVTALSYSTKQNSGPAVAAPSYQLTVSLDGSGAAATTLNFVFEPYWNGTVTPGVWQTWNVYTAEKIWTSKTVSVGGSCSFTNGAGGPPFVTLEAVKVACPNALVVAYGVNVGTYNRNYNVETDEFVFNSTTYDFEVYSTPTSMEDCKKGGWATFNPPSGPFKNQGQCVASTVPQ